MMESVRADNGGPAAELVVYTLLNGQPVTVSHKSGVVWQRHDEPETSHMAALRAKTRKRNVAIVKATINKTDNEGVECTRGAENA